MVHIKQSEPFSEWTSKTEAIQNLSYVKPLIVQDNKCLVVSSGASLYFYSCQTGDSIAPSLKLDEVVVCNVLHPTDCKQLFTFGERGTVYKIDLDTFTVQTTLQMNLKNAFKEHRAYKEAQKPIRWKVVHCCLLMFKNKAFAFVSWCWDKGTDKPQFEVYCKLSVFSLRNGGEKLMYPVALLNKQNNFCIGHTSDGYFIAAMAPRDVVLLRFTKISFSLVPFKVFAHSVNSKNRVTCIAAHPLEESFATGDTSGRIIVWKDIFHYKPIKSVHHWHFLDVLDIIYSENGNYLYSGGNERVLVKWSLSLNVKSFLPRLSSSIQLLSRASNNILLSVSTADHKILLINSNMECQTTVQNVSQWNIESVASFGPLFAVDPRSQCLVVSGKEGNIQFVSMDSSLRLNFVFNVSTLNMLVNPDKKAHNSSMFAVTHAAFSLTGEWFATVINLPHDRYQTWLKFWQFDTSLQCYKLVLSVNDPMDGQDIKCLECADNKLVLTGGTEFQLWVLDTQWQLATTGSYKSLPAGPADFSADMSLLSVGFGPVLTVWDTDYNVCKCFLTPPLCRTFLQFVKFGKGQYSHFVVTATATSLCSWNTLTLGLMWTVDVGVVHLIADPCSSFMAVFTPKNNVFLFKPHSLNSQHTFSAGSHRVLAATFSTTLGSSKVMSPIYFVNINHEFVTFRHKDDHQVVESTAVDEEHLGSLFGQLAHKSHSDVLQVRPQVLSVHNPSGTIASQLVSSPSYTCPAMSVMCSSFLSSLLLSQPTNASVSTTPSQPTGTTVLSKPDNRKGRSHKTEVELQRLYSVLFNH